MKIRKAFVMSVHAGAEEEYEKRHNPIWPELEKVLKDHGVLNYSIFLLPKRADEMQRRLPEAADRSVLLADYYRVDLRHGRSIFPIGSGGMLRKTEGGVP